MQRWAIFEYGSTEWSVLFEALVRKLLVKISCSCQRHRKARKICFGGKMAGSREDFTARSETSQMPSNVGKTSQ